MSYDIYIYRERKRRGRESNTKTTKSTDTHPHVERRRDERYVMKQQATTPGKSNHRKSSKNAKEKISGAKKAQKMNKPLKTPSKEEKTRNAP